jgi:predicted nucleic acid-binding Zn ribbon protein
MNQKCPYCNNVINPEDIFCSECGKKLPDKNAPFSTAQKIKMFLFSIILAPFGLYWFFKYFKDPIPEKKKTAYVILYITILMVLVLVVVNYYFIRSLTSSIEMYDYGIYGL